jgi:hypothetical protein
MVDNSVIIELEPVAARPWRPTKLESPCARSQRLAGLLHGVTVAVQDANLLVNHRKGRLPSSRAQLPPLRHPSLAAALRLRKVQ